MKKLNNTWFTEGLIDLEYQQYILLDYLQFTKNYYENYKIYPCLADLIAQLKNLKDFREKRKDTQKKFPRTISEIDFKNQKFIYKEELEDNDIMKTINNIVDFSIPLIEDHIKTGMALYESINTKLKFSPIGIQPIYKKEGYVLLQINNEVKVYQFNVKPILLKSENFISVNLEYVNSQELSLKNTNEKIKSKLIKKNKDIPNPSAYSVKIEKDFTQVLEETIFPIIKRRIMSMS